MAWQRAVKNWEPRSIPRVDKIERASSLPFHSQNSSNVSRQQFWASNIIIISLVLFKLRARFYCTESTYVQRRRGRLGKKASSAHTWNLTQPKIAPRDDFFKANGKNSLGEPADFMFELLDKMHWIWGYKTSPLRLKHNSVISRTENQLVREQIMFCFPSGPSFLGAALRIQK